MMGFQLLVNSVKGIQTWKNKDFCCYGVGHRESGVGNQQWGPDFPFVGWWGMVSHGGTRPSAGFHYQDPRNSKMGGEHVSSV